MLDIALWIGQLPAILPPAASCFAATQAAAAATPTPNNFNAGQWKFNIIARPSLDTEPLTSRPGHRTVNT